MEAVKTTFDAGELRALIDQAAETPISATGVPMVGRRKLANDLFFKKFDNDIVLDVLLNVMNYYPKYEAENEKIGGWKAKGYASLLELIIQCFFTILMPLSPTKQRRKPKESRKDKEQDPNIFVPKLKVTTEQTMRILQALIPISVRSDVWNLVSFLYSLHQTPELFVTMVMQAASQRTASYGSLLFVIKKPKFCAVLQDASILFLTALLGPLSAPVVEKFASNRSIEFREECRRVLLRLETCARSVQDWEAAVAVYHVNVLPGGQRRAKPLEYPAFSQSVMIMMNDLRRKFPQDDRIHEGYAFVKVKKCAENYYISGAWKAEHLHEALYTILHQRPAMRRYIVDLLEKKFEDKETANLWKDVDIKQRSRHDILPFENTAIEFHELNLPFLSIPKKVQSITFVNKPKKLRRLTQFLEKYSYEERPIIGLDAEWSSYVLYSKASILQIAFPTEIFLLDMIEFPPDVLSEFLMKLFNMKNILKIGFQFHEDLTQLRRAVPKCQSLYRPQNLICIGALVQTLLKESAKRSDVDLEGIIHPIASKSAEENANMEGLDSVQMGNENPGDTEYVELEIVNSAQDSGPLCSSATATEDADNNNDDDDEMEDEESSKGAEGVEETTNEKQKKKGNKKDKKDKKKNENIEIKGLSQYCEVLLGSPLDKTEQCSVWDRRPLRDLQIRYAALDAYVMLMMFEKCAEWASRLDLSINQLCDSQPPVTLQLPLFFSLTNQ